MPATAALATAPARGGIAVILLQGPRAIDILRAVFRPGLARGMGVSPAACRSQFATRSFKPNTAGETPATRLVLGRIVHQGQELDQAVVSVSAAAEGGLSIEINIHGGPHVARRVLAALEQPGAKVTDAAAFDSTLLVSSPAAGTTGNIAIAQEALIALTQATTPLAASAIAAQWSGGLTSLAQSALEAVAAGNMSPVAPRLRSAAAALPLMRRLLEPAEVVIAGPPNAGKSALANALVGRNASIVADAPGTTRDWVRTLTDAQGVPIWLTDTAGLWEAVGPAGIDAEAVRRAWQRVAAADLVLFLTAGEATDQAMLARLACLPNVIRISGKADILPPEAACELAISSTTGQGLPELLTLIRRRLGMHNLDPTAALAFTTRQAECLVAAAEGFERGNLDAARAGVLSLLNGA